MDLCVYNNPVLFYDPDGNEPKTPKYMSEQAKDEQQRAMDKGGAEVIKGVATTVTPGGNVVKAGQIAIKVVKAGTAVKVGTTVATQSITTKKVADLSKNAQNAFKKYNDAGWKGNVSGQTPGTGAGGVWKNSKNQLPTKDARGNSITYREFDVNNKLPNASRDGERFVRGSDGSVYYTNDHYRTFIKVN